MPVIIFPTDGQAVIEGIWTTITAARAFDARILNIDPKTTHWVHYTGGGTQDMNQKPIAGATSAATAFCLAQIVEQGTIGAGTASGCLLLNNVSGTFVAEKLYTVGGTGADDCDIADTVLPVRAVGQARAVYITVEVATMTFTVTGTIPTVSGGTNLGFQMTAGQNLTLRGITMLKAFQAINTVNANGTIMKYALLF